MENYLKNLKNLSSFFIVLIIISWFMALIKFNWLSTFFGYFDYHGVSEWLFKYPDIIMPYQYISNIFFGKTEEGILKLILLAIAYLSFLGYIKSKKIFIDDDFKLNNTFEIFILIKDSLNLIILFLAPYLIVKQIFEFKISNVSYQLLSLVSIYLINPLFMKAMKKHIECFSNYQKISEYAEYTKLGIFYLLNSNENVVKLTDTNKDGVNDSSNESFDLFDKIIDYFLSVVLYRPNYLSLLQTVTAIMSVCVIYMGLLLYFNLFSILFIFLNIVQWFTGLSVISYSFRLKSTIFLTNGEVLNDVYIIEENLKRPHIKVINENNEKTSIMKSSIIKIVNEPLNFDLETKKQNNSNFKENNE